MLLRLLVLFICVPLVELYLLLQLAEATSLGVTLATVIVTGVIGSFLAKREGVMAWRRFRSALGEPRMPSREIQDGLMIVFAAALLLTPGLITDAVGFTLLVPAGRSFIRRHVLPRFVGNVNVKVFTSAPASQGQPRGSFRGTTIDAEAVEHRPE